MNNYKSDLCRLEAYAKNRRWTLYLLSLYKMFRNYNAFKERGPKGLMFVLDLAELHQIAESFQSIDKINLKESGSYHNNNLDEITRLKNSITTEENGIKTEDGFLFLYVGEYKKAKEKLKFQRKRIPLFPLPGKSGKPQYRSFARESFYTEVYTDPKYKLVVVDQLYKNIDDVDPNTFDMNMELIINRIKLETDLKNLLLYFEGIDKSTDEDKKEFLTNIIIEILTNLLEGDIKFEKLVFGFDVNTNALLFNSILDDILNIISYDGDLGNKYKAYLNKFISINKKKSKFEIPVLDTTEDPAIIFRKKFSANCKKLDDMFRHINAIKDKDVSILLCGETGSGKQVLAELIHNESNRRDRGRFEELNCGSVPKELLHSALFGHEKGAFTGAINQKKGVFELANNGTLLLDEIGEAPLDVQLALLKVLDTKKFKRVGGEQDIKVNVRIIYATNADLENLVKEQKFKEDLFYRIKGNKFNLLPLREKLEDFPYLVDSFRANYENENKIKLNITEDFIEQLKLYHWQGNHREFNTILETIFILAPGESVKIIDAKIAKKFISFEDKIRGDINFIEIEESITEFFKSWLPVRTEISDLVDKQWKLITGNAPRDEQKSFKKSIIEPILANIYINNFESLGLGQGEAGETIGLGWKAAKGKSDILQKHKLYPIVEKYFK